MSRAHKVNISKGRRKLSAHCRQYTRRHDWAGRSKEESLFSQFYLRICRLGGALDILAEGLAELLPDSLVPSSL